MLCGLTDHQNVRRWPLRLVSQRTRRNTSRMRGVFLCMGRIEGSTFGGTRGQPRRCKEKSRTTRLRYRQQMRPSRGFVVAVALSRAGLSFQLPLFWNWPYFLALLALEE